MEPLKKYYANISTLANSVLEKEKRLAALDEIAKQINREFSGEKSHVKKPETSVLNNLTNIENLFWALLSNLQTYNETSHLFLDVLCLACKHLLKKLKKESQIKISDVCVNLAEKAFAEKYWLLFDKCFKFFKCFENREWSNVLSNEELKGRIFKIIHSVASVGKDTLCSKNRKEFAFQIVCIEVLSNILKTELFKTDDIFKPNECFVLLFPFLFDENCELRKIAYQTFVFLKNHCPNVCCHLLEKNSSLREQLKISYSKKLAQFARTNESDWIDLWCFMVDLLGEECTARKNTDLINNLLQAEEIGFRSSNMNTRYNAFVGWKFLVNRFLDTSLEDSSRRLKLLMQPLITSNSKTTDILCIKFEIWWQLIMGIEPCIQRHVTNIIYHFLNFCFGPVGDGSTVNNGCTNSDIPNTLASRRPAISNVTNYPLVTTRRWRGLEGNRADALAQILNLNDNPSKEFKLQNFKSPVLSSPQTFLCLSKMLIHCVGECTILSTDCKDMSSQERKSYLKEIWISLLLHVRKVHEMPTSAGQESSERQEKTEMMKNMFRILLRLNEIALSNQQLANICLNPILEIILSPENGLPDEVLTSRNYYVGTDVMMGTPLSILLDVFLSPAFLSIQAHGEDVRSANDVLYMVLLQRVVHLGVTLCENVILFTQTVIKRIDAVVSNGSVKGNRVKSIWILLTRKLTSSYVGEGRDINQGTEENADFSWLMGVLMFPVIHSKIFLTDQDMILRIWAQLDQAFQRNVTSNIQSIKGNEICCIICSKVQQELLRKKNINSDELLHIMCLVTCAIEQIPFSTLNKIISCGNISESEKLTHVQQCFQVLQTLSVEIQKLKVEDNLYLPIVSQYAKCYQMFCNNLKECPLQFLTLFFIEQIQFILSVKIVMKETPSSKLFSSTCVRTWKSFLCILLSGCLQTKKQNKKTIVKMIQPALLSSFTHADHAIHEITITFSITEDINMQTNYECNKCRIMQERMSTGRNSLLSPKSPSEVNDKLKELFARPLTKHQKESFRQRRDDIPALYEDLTQDSQPSFSDSQDSFQMMAANPVIDNDATSIGECVSIPRDTSFQSKENIPLKKLLTDSSDDASRKTGNIKNVKCLKTVVSPKHTDHYTGKSEALIVKSPKSSQQSQNEVEVIDMSPNSQKTSPVKKLTFKADVGRPTNAPIVTNVKENLGSEAKKVKSEAKESAMPNILKTKFRRQSPASTHHPIKVCISKLQTDSPEVKRIVLKLPIGSQINSVRESKQTHVKKINDLIKNMQNFSSPKTSTCDENVCTSSHIEQDTSNKLDKSIKSISRENAADTLTSTKNGEASDNCQKSPAVKEENLNLISCQGVVTSKEHSDPNIKSSERDRDETTKGTSECIEQNPEKQMENGSKVLPPNNQVVSPAKVILKRLEINDVNNYTCRALLFKDQEHSSSEILNEERLVKLSSESGNNELKASKLDLKPSSNLLNSDKDLLSEKLISTSSEEVGKLEKESREQQSVEVFVPKEVKSKSCVSQTQDSESTSHAEQHTKTKIPTPSYQTRQKGIKTYHFTRSYDKKRLSKKNEQNQMSNSPKENVVAENVLSQKKSDAVEIVNQRQLKTLILVQNYQNSLSSSHEPSNKLDFESPTSTAKNSKRNAVDKTKEDKLEVNCSGIINIQAEIENVHTDSQLVNHIQNSCSKLSDERAGDKTNQNKLKDSEISVCGPETQQQQSIDGGELSTTSPKTSHNKHEPPSFVEDMCAKEVQKQEYTEIRTECLPKVDKPNKMEQVIGDCSNQESREEMLDAKSNSSKSITHYFPIIPIPESSTPSHVNLKDKSLTSKSSNSVNSESVGGGQIMLEQLQTSVSEMPRKKLDEHNNDLSKKISSTVPDTSCREVSSQISCDKGEYVRSLSLMPQNANSAVQPKAHKISTRSDWARRFGCRLETDVPKNNDDCFEKNSDENVNFSNNLTADVLDCEDVVESSQPKKVVFKDCCIALPKLSITLGSILSGVEGDLMVSEEISSGLFRVMDKSCEKGNDAQIESADNVEKIEELETPIYETSDEIPENTASMNPDTMQQVSVVEILPVEIEQSDASVRNDHGGVDSCESPDRIQLLENKEKDITKCSESYDEKPKDTEIIDLTFDESNERENMDIQPNEIQNVLIETENPLSVSEELDQDKKRKRKRNDETCKTYSKRRRIMQLCSNNESNEGTEESPPENANLDGISTDVTECKPISHNNEETEKSSPSKFSVGANLLNGSPMKIKRSKHLVRSEDSSSPSRKHMSGRAAQLVDLALTKKSIHAKIDLPTPSTSSEVELEESNHDVIFSFNAEGEEEKSPWVRSSPQAEASPGKANLKRKHSVDNGETPSRKSVRFSDPEVTRKLHFQKIESPEKTTFRIVRTKKGKLYVQKNTSNTKDRVRRVDRSTEPKPVWPNLKDCTSPVSDVTDQLAVTGDCKDMLISSLDSRNICTIGELCSLTESDIDELPVKAPKIIVFKLVMQAYEDRMKNLQSYKAIRQQRLQQENCSGNITSTDLKTHLSSMSRDAIVDLLKESLSEADLKEVAANFNNTVLASSSTSIGVSTELETEDKASSTDDSILQQLDYFLPEALKKQDEQNGQKKILLHVLQMLLHHCGVSHTFEEFWEVVSNSDFEPPKGNINAVNQCFKFLQYLCTGSALPLERAREFYEYSIRQFGEQSVLSEILKCGESEHKTPVFLKDVMNCLKEKLCANKESAAEVFQCLITDSSIPLAIEHCTAKQLVPHVTNKFGDLTVLDTVLTGSTMTREKALDSLKKYLSSEDVDEKKWMDTIFELINLSGIAKDKRNLMLTLLNSAIDLVRYK